jgi:Putative peptidoglycan binding domain
MKKTLFLLILLTLLSFTGFSSVSAETVLAENTSELCIDGIDNDEDNKTDIADPECSVFPLVIIPEIVIVPENTKALCKDGMDNDVDNKTDLADPECSQFASDTLPPTLMENTQILCIDGEDNDGDNKTDLADPECSIFLPVATSTPATTTPETVPNNINTGSGSTGSNFGSGPSFGSGFSSGLSEGTPVSSVIATSSPEVCSDTFTTYMRKGSLKNNKNEVKKLQNFLNENLGLNIPLTGFFGNLTHDAVMKFQLKYSGNVLNPWGINYATGYFYKTTQRQANMLLCRLVEEIPMPVLN